MNPELPDDEAAILRQAESRLDAQDYAAAIRIAKERLDRGVDTSTPAGAYLAFRLAGTLIDVGSESHQAQPVHDALALVDSCRPEIAEVVGEAHLEYVLGNAKDALFDSQHHDRSFIPMPAEINLLVEAKNHFWRAYRTVPEDNVGLMVELCVNLGNTLRKSFRIIEALQFYDTALQVVPSFGMAHMNRAITLHWLELETGTVSKNQLVQIARGYEAAAKSTRVPPGIRRIAVAEAALVRERLVALGTSAGDDEDAATIARETEEHQPYRKALLANHLTLSEHALICSCVGARTDDLSIPTKGRPLAGSAIPRMELLTNRLKSEFSLARYCYYKGTRGDPGLKRRFDPVAYTELMDGECVGIVPEMLRTSVRLCFGILDKIAHGLCDFFEWVPPRTTHLLPWHVVRRWDPRTPRHRVGTNEGQQEPRRRWALQPSH